MTPSTGTPPPPAASRPVAGGSERIYATLFGAISSSVMVHRGDRILFANAALERLTARSQDELIAMPFHAIAHPDDRAALLARAGPDGEAASTDHEFRVCSANGEIRWVEMRATRVDLDGEPTVICSIYDLTERKRAEAAREHMQRLLAQIIDGDPVPTFVIDASHRVTHWNKACATITGVAAEQMIGTTRQWAAFYPAERPVMADLIVDGALESGFETHYRGKFRRSPKIEGAFEAEDFFPQFGEQGCWLYFTAAPLRDAAGQVIGAIETLLDVTSRHRAEDELRQHQAQLEELVARRTEELAQANQQLLQSEKMASIGQLAAGVAHEINNPIGYVHSNIGTLEGYIADLFRMLDAYEAACATPLTEERRGGLAALRDELDIDYLKEDIPALVAESREGITRVKKIVQDLKDFSHADADQEWHWADLHQGIDSTINIVTNEVKYKADIIREYGSLPEVECLPSQLNQVFMNLLVNAAHAMGETRGHIVIRTGGGPDEVWIEFADDGCGIAPEIRPRIFDPFFTTKPIGKGTGLGLSLSYGIVQKHNGRIELDSTPGKGSTFRVVLPVRQPATSAPAGATP